jgi:ankyrin repeat protein
MPDGDVAVLLSKPSRASHNLGQAVPSMLLSSSAAIIFLVVCLIRVESTAASALPIQLTGDCVKFILKTSDLSPPPKPKHASLLHAASDNSIESVCLLLQQGADINGRNKYVIHFERVRDPVTSPTLRRQNVTALHASILPSVDQFKMVHLLLQHGADVNAKDMCDC